MADRFNMSLKQIATVLGGEISGGQVRAPGPGHSPKDRSLAVMLSSTAADGFVVYSHAGDDPFECKDYVRERSGLAPFKPRGAPIAQAAAMYGTVGDHGMPSSSASPRRASRLACASGKKLSRCAHRHRVGGTRSRSAGGTSRNVAGCTLASLMTCPTRFAGMKALAPSSR